MRCTRASAPRRAATFAIGAALVAVVACGSPSGFDPEAPRAFPTEPVAVAPEPEPGRRITRLTAGQLHASLELATGQAWSDFESVAATLGRPDYQQSTSEGLQDSPAVERILAIAADDLCARAIASDRTRDAGDAERVLIRDLDLEAPTESTRAANLRRLVLRFHGHVVDDASDLSPYELLLDAPISPADLGGGATAADVEATRWQAVCVALALHPDFLFY